MRPIDADALKEEICKRYHFCQRLAISSVFEAIKEAPSIDAVPREKYDRMKENAKILSKACAEKEYVVRCKDCKNWDKDWQTIEGCHYCGMADKQTEGDFFCGDGERKEE